MASSYSSLETYVAPFSSYLFCELFKQLPSDPLLSHNNTLYHTPKTNVLFYNIDIVSIKWVKKELGCCGIIYWVWCAVIDSSWYTITFIAPSVCHLRHIHSNVTQNCRIQYQLELIISRHQDSGIGFLKIRRTRWSDEGKGRWHCDWNVNHCWTSLQPGYWFWLLPGYGDKLSENWWNC